MNSLNAMISSIGFDQWTDILFEKQTALTLDKDTQKQLRRFFLRKLTAHITEQDCENCASYCKGYSDALQHLTSETLDVLDAGEMKELCFNDYTRGWFQAKQDAMLLAVKLPEKPQPRKATEYDRPQKI